MGVGGQDNKAVYYSKRPEATWKGGNPKLVYMSLFFNSIQFV